MSARELMHLYVTRNRKEYSQVTIPADMNEVVLKAYLRDLGYISSYRESYSTTKVFLEDDTKTNLTEICTDKCRSLKELGIQEKSRIVIQDGKPEPRPVVRNRSSLGGGRCLYGCPMAHSVEEAINEAERYSEKDSIVATGTVEESK